MEKVKYTREEYRNEYLKSDEWKNLRNLIMVSKPDCQSCGKPATDVHHMTYRNIVDIKVTDLLPVCRTCHEFIHEAINDNYISQDSKEIEEIKRKTVGILFDEEYRTLKVWLNSKHKLDFSDIEEIKKLQPFVLKKISALSRKNVWYQTLGDILFTGKQVLKIKELIKTALYRKARGSDKPKKRMSMGGKDRSKNGRKWKPL